MTDSTHPTTAAEPALEARLRRHGDAVNAFIARGRAVPVARAEQPRAPGKWTPVQEVVHLALTYTEFATALQGGSEFTLLVPAETAAHYHRTYLPRILAGGWFPSGAAAPERVQPGRRSQEMSEALSRLETAVQDFHAAALTAVAAYPDRTWTHPYFGPLSVPDLIDLLTEHTGHHARFLP